MRHALLFLVLASLASPGSAADAPPPAAASAPANPQANKDTVIIPVFLSEEDKTKGILLTLPKTLSASKRGTTVEFSYLITNALEEQLFVETHPEDQLTVRYADGAGGFSSHIVGTGAGQHEQRYALLLGSEYIAGERNVSCCSNVNRKAKIAIPANAKPGTDLDVTIGVSGFFLKNGQPFFGKVKAAIKLSE